MQLPIPLFYAGVFAIFALLLSFMAGSARGKSGVSILHGDPVDMKLAEKVRRHQNFLEDVPMFLIVFAALEINGVPSLFLYIVGDLMIVSRIFHAFGLHHDNMGHIGRLIGAGGTALLTLVCACYAVWLSANALLA